MKHLRLFNTVQQIDTAKSSMEAPYVALAEATDDVVYSGTSELDGYVDLGLPSGLKWATCNLGATSETEYGDYYMWGSTTPNTDSICLWETTPYHQGSKENNGWFKYNTLEAYGDVDNQTVLVPQDDAVYQATNGVAHMPTKADFDELLENTTSQWVTNYKGSGVNGELFTSKSNGNTMFIPASGSRWDSDFDDRGDYCDVWSSSLYTENPSGALVLGFNSDECIMGSNGRCSGLCVRGVKN